MKNYILLVLVILVDVFAQHNANGQTTSAANWAWGKDFNPSSTIPPKICFKDGFVYTAGQYVSTLYIESQTFPNNGGSDIYLAKWDTAGNLIWVQTISQADHQSVSNIHVKDNKIVLTGAYNSSTLQVGNYSITNNGLYDLFIANFDTNGYSTALYNYGTVGNDYISSSCIDNNFNIYIAGDSLYKFSISGSKLWGKNYNARHVFYSTIDSSIVIDGDGPASSYTSGATGFTYYYNDIITRKLNLLGDSIWKKTFTIDNGNYFLYSNPGMYLSDYNQDNDCLYIGYSSHYHISQNNYATLVKVAPNGVESYIYTYPDNSTFATFSNISSNKNYVAFSFDVYGSGLNTFVLNTSTNGIIKEYSNYSPTYQNSYEFIDTNLIFAHGNNGIAQHTFGKFGQDTIQVIGNSTYNFCLGATGNLYPTIVGGTPPYSFSWSPVTGLNSTTTQNTSLTATTNTTYTLTVTDANNYSFSKAFNVNIVTPLNINITAQYPFLCDSMQLFSNTGSTGYWIKNTTPNSTFLGQGENFTIYSSGQYIFQQYNQCGWSRDTIDIISGSSTSTTNVSLCWSQLPFVWNGQNVTASGIYTDTSVNSLGCDSIATLNLTVKPTSFSFHTVSLCSNQLPFIWNGQNLNTSGIYTDTSTNSLGCDSVSTLDFIVIPTTSSNNILSLCSNQLPYVWNGQSLSQSGFYQDTLINSVGCDSITTLQLTVNPITFSFDTLTVCSNQVPYVWNGQSLIQSGLYLDTLINSVGCDSIASLQLTVNSISFSSETLTICSNQVPYIWNGQSLSQSGLYQDTLTNSVGCDSISSLHLTVNPISFSFDTLTVCSNQIPYVWNGQNLSQSGLYQDTLINSVGCDSIASLLFTVNPISFSNDTLTVCSNQIPYMWNGQSISQSGLYMDTLINSVGCDSITSLHLTVNPISFSFDTLTVCSNQIPYVWNGQNISQSGLYQDTLINSVGCDSVASLQFNVNTNPFAQILPSTDTSVCIGTGYILYVDSTIGNQVWSLNGNTISSGDTILISTSGNYVLTITDSNSCVSTDSVSITLNPSPQPSILWTNSLLVCTNSANVNYQWYFNNLPIGTNADTVTITQNGLYAVVTTDSLGCIGIDSIHIISLGSSSVLLPINDLKLYPNPTSNSIFIDYFLLKDTKISLQIVDVVGNVITKMSEEKQVQGQQSKEINLQSFHLSNGVYLLQLSDGIHQWNLPFVYRP